MAKKDKPKNKPEKEKEEKVSEPSAVVATMDAPPQEQNLEADKPKVDKPKEGEKPILVVMTRLRIKDQKATGPIAIELDFDPDKKKTFGEATDSIGKLIQSVISACVGGMIDKEKIKEATLHAIRFWKKPVENDQFSTRVWTKPKDLGNLDLQLSTEQKGALRWMLRTYKDIVFAVLKDQNMDVTTTIHDKIWDILRSKIAQFLRDDILEVRIHFLPMTQERISPPQNYGKELILEAATAFYVDDKKLFEKAQSYLLNTGYGYTRKFDQETREKFLAKIAKKKETGQWKVSHDPRTLCDWMVAELHGLLGHSHAAKEPAKETVPA